MAESKDTDFLKHADECALHAAAAQSDHARDVWTKIEQYWRKRAAGAEAPLVSAHRANSSERAR
jgi:hypothetical protein